jgi:hypothetical protein
MKHIHSYLSSRVGAENTLSMRLRQPSMRRKNETKTKHIDFGGVVIEFKGMVSLGCKLDEEIKI